MEQRQILFKYHKQVRKIFYFKFEVHYKLSMENKTINNLSKQFNNISCCQMKVSKLKLLDLKKTSREVKEDPNFRNY